MVYRENKAFFNWAIVAVICYHFVWLTVFGGMVYAAILDHNQTVWKRNLLSVIGLAEATRRIDVPKPKKIIKFISEYEIPWA